MAKLSATVSAMSRQTVLALAAGRMPDGIDPQSAQGLAYQATLDELERLQLELEEHPLSDAQVARVVALLRSA